LDVRKLISFGKGTFIVSMPKPWVEKNHLKKGDLISIADDGHELIIRANSEEQKIESKEIIIDASDKSLDFLRVEIVSAYLSGYDVINIQLHQNSKNFQQIKEILRNLSGMEIMEQTSTRISAKNLCDLASALRILSASSSA